MDDDGDLAANNWHKHTIELAVLIDQEDEREESERVGRKRWQLA